MTPRRWTATPRRSAPSWEWCWDWYDGSYPSGALVDPTGPASGSDRVGRGGSWNFSADDARAADRYLWYPDYRNGALGLRLSRSLP